ncbi:MAG: hypothetical protein ACPGWR_08960 [Ardenticatenaceae bacterium]
MKHYLQNLNWKLYSVMAIVGLILLSTVVPLAYNRWVEIQCQAGMGDFDESRSPDGQAESLARLFRLKGLFFSTGCHYKAKYLFYHELSPEEQLALFEPDKVDESDLIELVQGLYTTLPAVDLDVNRVEPTRKLLGQMLEALNELDPAEQPTDLKKEIETLLRARNLAELGEYEVSLGEYDKAFELNSKNPAMLYERARVRAKLGQHEAALEDLERMIEIANETRAPIIPTATPQTPEATPTPATSEFYTPEKIIEQGRNLIENEEKLGEALAAASESGYRTLQEVIRQPTATRPALVAPPTLPTPTATIMPAATPESSAIPTLTATPSLANVTPSARADNPTMTPSGTAATETMTPSGSLGTETVTPSRTAVPPTAVPPSVTPQPPSATPVPPTLVLPNATSVLPTALPSVTPMPPTSVTPVPPFVAIADIWSENKSVIVPLLTGAVLAVVVVVVVIVMVRMVRMVRKRFWRLPSQNTALIVQDNSVFIEKEHLIEALLKEDLDRISAKLHTKGGTRLFLTGFGSFGGTSLVRSSMKKLMQQNLKNNQASQVLVIRFDTSRRARSGEYQLFINETKGVSINHKVTNSELLAKVKDVLAQPAKLRDLQSSNPDLFKGMTAVFAQDPTSSEAIAGLVSQVLKLLQSKHDDRQIHEALDKLRPNPSSSQARQLLLVIDHVEQAETMQRLLNGPICDELRYPWLSLIVVARHQTFNRWPERLRQQVRDPRWMEYYYVRRLWLEDFDVQERLKHFMHIDVSALNKQERDRFDRLLAHLTYQARGSVARVMRELKKGPYLSKKEGQWAINLDEVYTHGRENIEHNVYAQKILDQHWRKICSEGLVSGRVEMADQAKVGVYYVIEWIRDHPIFSWQELLAAAGQEKADHITISDNQEIREEILGNLLHVLEQEHYLEPEPEPDRYRLAWQKTRPSRIKKTTRTLIGGRKPKSRRRGRIRATPTPSRRTDTGTTPSQSRTHDAKPGATHFQSTPQQAKADASQSTRPQAKADAFQSTPQQAKADASQSTPPQAKADASQSTPSQAKADASQSTPPQAKTDASQSTPHDAEGKPGKALHIAFLGDATGQPDNVISLATQIAFEVVEAGYALIMTDRGGVNATVWERLVVYCGVAEAKRPLLIATRKDVRSNEKQEVIPASGPSHQLEEFLKKADVLILAQQDRTTDSVFAPRMVKLMAQEKDVPVIEPSAKVDLAEVPNVAREVVKEAQKAYAARQAAL